MWRAAFFALCAHVLAGCVSQMQCEPTTGQCVQTGGAPEAAATAAAAGALWVGAGGCATAGCRYPMQCNEGTGLCEYPACGELRSCPAGLSCDQSSNTCR